MPDEQVKTVIAIADSSDALPALAAAQVITTLLDMQKIICDCVDEATSKQLPRDSVILLTETQLINHLGLLRLNGFGGAVIVITFANRSFDDLKTDYPILKYGGHHSHDVWGSPWQVSELLEKVTKIEYLLDGNLEALQKNLEAIIEHQDRQFIEILRLNLQRISYAKDPATFILELDTLANTFNTMLVNNSDARHHQIQIHSSDYQSISFHFQTLIQEIRFNKSCSPEQIENLKFIFTQFHNRVRRTVEGLVGFRSA